MPEFDVILTAKWSDSPAQKCDVTIKLFDDLNEENVGEIKVTLYQTTTFHMGNIQLPEGYKLSDEMQSITVNVFQGDYTSVAITFNVFECITIEGVDFRYIHSYRR